MSVRRVTASGALVLALVLPTAGCLSEPDPAAPTVDAPRPVPASVTSPGPLPAALGVSRDPYVGLAQMLHARHVRVWFESDLVARWQEGSASFHAAVRRLGRLGRVPGTVGFKIADELGYQDGLSSPAGVLRFLRASRAALHQVAPHRKILVDAVVPELGCLPWLGAVGRACATRARRDYPGADIRTVRRYLRLGLVDRIDLSSGLLDASDYAARGLRLGQAQRRAWWHVSGWTLHSGTSMQARKALAQDGGYHGSAAQAASDVSVYVETPLRLGASAVDVWTWRQPYDGGVASLLDPGLHGNPLWRALERQRLGGARLLTHATPSAMPHGGRTLAHECDLLARVFRGVFVAAGTG